MSPVHGLAAVGPVASVMALEGRQNVMRNAAARGVVVVLILVVAGCNPFLDRLTGPSARFAGTDFRLMAPISFDADNR
jgi:hypothetical protein